MMKNIIRERKPSASPLVRSQVEDLLSIRNAGKEQLENPSFQMKMFATMSDAIVARADELRRSFSLSNPNVPLALSESSNRHGSQSLSLVTRAGTKELELVRVSFGIGERADNCEYEPGPVFQVSYRTMFYKANETDHFSRPDSVFGIFESIIGKEGWLGHEKAAQAILRLLGPKGD